ncbi:cysteine hydrolase family protein [Ruminococcus sp. XPD3002]|uniref:cysteine hydrolase family protein n=1 Tax=Ruminococcus sp. XPD3002 TaxID=1452269 RepID=UPI000923094C|nr:Nicotinamidase-related amidase [Ruminococcus flavefaciens]
MKVLIVIDMQNDFTVGVLGNPQTAAVTEKVVRAIEDFRSKEKDGQIIATLDTHYENYMETQEGKNLPVPHCIKGSEGWKLVPEVDKALGENCLRLEKKTFGAIDLPEKIADGAEEFIIMGVCTDICVISNAMILKAAFPEIPVRVISDCCAGVTPESHNNALNAMRSCQMIID